MPPSSDPVGETLEQLVARFLRTVPVTWTEHDLSALSARGEQALSLLTAAGLIERRTTFRLQMFGHPGAVEATITFTGEYGLVEAVSYVSARMWEDWHEGFEKRSASDLKGEPAFHCEWIGKEQWRLTAKGVEARNDLASGDSSTVFDFVLRRGFFDGQSRHMPDGRISRRQPVRGHGTLEKLGLVHPAAAPVGVSIVNWDDGGKAIAAAFAELKAHVPTSSAPPPDVTQQAKWGTPQIAGPDGPFDGDGFRFAGVEVRFGRAAKQYALVWALWDTAAHQPSAARAIEDVITVVYGEENDTEDATFRQLCADVRRRFESRNLPLSIEYLNGRVQFTRL